MKKIAYVLIGILFVFSTAANADNKEKKTVTPAVKTAVFGKIVDQSTGESLAGVQIKIDGISKIYFSDLEGNFEIEGVTPGTYQMSVDFISYKKSVIKDLKIENNKPSALKIQLKQ